MNNYNRKQHIELNAKLQEGLTVDSFDPAIVESEFDKLDQVLNGAIQEREGMELAIALNTFGENADAAPSFLAKADPYRILAEKKPKQAQARIEELDELIEGVRPKWDLARHRRQLAREEQARQLAIAFKPRHRLAVQVLANALTALSEAVAAEQSLHHEFQEQMPGFAALPDFGGAWRAVLLTDPRSAASSWLSAARSMGYVK